MTIQRYRNGNYCNAKRCGISSELRSTNAAQAAEGNEMICRKTTVSVELRDLPTARGGWAWALENLRFEAGEQGGDAYLWVITLTRSYPIAIGKVKNGAWDFEKDLSIVRESEFFSDRVIEDLIEPVADAFVAQRQKTTDATTLTVDIDD